jgi:hypothetical protein
MNASVTSVPIRSTQRTPFEMCISQASQAAPANSGVE